MRGSLRSEEGRVKTEVRDQRSGEGKDRGTMDEKALGGTGSTENRDTEHKTLPAARDRGFGLFGEHEGKS